jgi:hypothetical protein
MSISMNLQEKRELLNKAGGRIFHVSFTKADGTVRKLSAKIMVHKSFTEGHASKAKANPAAHKPELFTCVEVGTGAWKNVNLNNLLSATVDGKSYEFKEVV